MTISIIDVNFPQPKGLLRKWLAQPKNEEFLEMTT